jgi:uncharacterized membrane protein YgcG
MDKRFWIGFLLLAAVSAFAQDCDKTVVDGAGVLGGKTSEVAAKAQMIVAQSGDVRVVTLGNLPGTLEQYVQQRKEACPSWQNTSGGVKSNLVVLVVAPAARKFGVFFGTGWDGALKDSVPNIKSQFMAPAFRDGDWARGLIQGEEQVGNRLKAFNEAALHPQQTTVENDAADLNGLWTVLGWTLGVTLLVSLGVMLYRVRKRREAERQEIEAAQQEAQQTSAAVADKLSKINVSLAQRKALDEDVTATQRAVDLIAEQYARYANTLSCSPSTEGLSARQYEGMTGMYQRLSDSLDRVDKKGPEVVATGPTKHSKWKTIRSRHQHETAPAPSSIPQPVSYSNTTTIIDNSGPGYVPIPVIIEEPAPYYAPEPVHHTSYTAPADDSSFGGSSSGWGSDSGSSSFSDDSSSSSFDSGSSSDFGGSSSDF